LIYVFKDESERKEFEDILRGRKFSELVEKIHGSTPISSDNVPTKTSGLDKRKAEPKLTKEKSEKVK